MSTTQFDNLRGPPAAGTGRQTISAVVQDRYNPAPEGLRDLVEAGELLPAIDRSYPLGEVAAAIRHMLDGKARGKLAVSVSPGRMQTPATGSTT
jgi:NADPH:quinone reductase-like Zn-dependent oxidoreductase